MQLYHKFSFNDYVTHGTSFPFRRWYVMKALNKCIHIILGNFQYFMDCPEYRLLNYMSNLLYQKCWILNKLKWNQEYSNNATVKLIILRIFQLWALL